MSTAPLPDRFSKPLTEYTMAELQAHNAMLQSEAQRVANICAYYEREVFSKKPKPQPRAAKLRSIR